MIAAGVVVGMAAASPAAQAAPATTAPSADGSTPAQPGPYTVGRAVPDGKVKLQSRRDDPSAKVQVFVQFSGVGSFSAWSGQQSAGAVQQRSAALAKRSAIKQTANSVLGAARRVDSGAKVLYTTSNAIPGVAMSVKVGALSAISARRDVLKVTQLVPKKVSNAGAAQLTRVLNTWQSTGLLGDNIKVGIIDTGIDYTHADFGGPGTVDAYEAAQATADQQTWTAPSATNVKGGIDFVGDDYNANDPDSVAAPDADPLDCNGHGTHVAGTVAGKGVTADGATFDGDYSRLTASALNGMKIGPGMAPEASLYGLKVFGCDGSTNYTAAALNYALDPNNDGNFADRMNIVNLSLGSDYSGEDDPDNALVDFLAQNGVLPVIAAGNAGDTTDAAGAPGNAVRALTVANSVDATSLLDGVKVTAPSDVARTYPGQNSADYPWATADPVSGTVAAIPGSNADGCQPLSSGDAAKVNGKIAWLEWDDTAARRCGSKTRTDNIEAAGALGAVFTSTLNTFEAGIAGNTTIPVQQLTGDSTDALRPAATAGTLQVTFDGSTAGSILNADPAVVDTLNSSSSRGSHGLRGWVKPDVAAPGTSITSAGVGTGNGPLTISGTSMATPHVAGIAALVKQAHPTWSVEQLKAAIMNSAGNDVYTGENKTGTKYAPARIGSGRADALAAVGNEVLAYTTAKTGAVSVGFGVTFAPASSAKVTKTQTVKVYNTGSAGRTLAVSYEALNTNPGISYSVSPSSLYLGPKATGTVTVTMTIVPSKVTHKIDPTMATTLPNLYTGLDEPRQFVADASGRLLLADSTTNQLTGTKLTLRVPVYGVAKANSTTLATKATAGGKNVIKLTGSGVAGPNPSLLSVMQFGGRNGALPTCSATTDPARCARTGSDRAGDLKVVGVGSAKGPSNTYADGFLWFGMLSYSPWAVLNRTQVPYADIWLQGHDPDTTPADYTVFGMFSPEDATFSSQNDVLMAALQDNSTGNLVSVLPVNYNYGDVDTNVFDSTTMLLPVDPAALGVTASTKYFRINYAVGVYDNYTGLTRDEIRGKDVFNVVAPWVSSNAPIYSDQGNTTVPLNIGQFATQGTQAMVVHLKGDPTRRVDLVTVK